MKDRVPVKLKTIRRGSAFYFEKPHNYCQDIWCKLYYVSPNKLYKTVTVTGHPDVRYASGDTLVYKY